MRRVGAIGRPDVLLHISRDDEFCGHVSIAIIREQSIVACTVPCKFARVWAEEMHWDISGPPRLPVPQGWTGLWSTRCDAWIAEYVGTGGGHGYLGT